MVKTTTFLVIMIILPRAAGYNGVGARPPGGGWMEVSRGATPRDCAEYYGIRHRGPPVP